MGEYEPERQPAAPKCISTDTWNVAEIELLEKLCLFQQIQSPTGQQRPTDTAESTPNHQVIYTYCSPALFQEDGIGLWGWRRTVNSHHWSCSLTLTMVLHSVAMQLPVGVFKWWLSQWESSSFYVSKWGTEFSGWWIHVLHKGTMNGCSDKWMKERCFTKAKVVSVHVFLRSFVSEREGWVGRCS